VADNRAIGRRVVATERARASIEAAYGPLLPSTSDTRVAVPSLADMLGTVPSGTRYVVCVLRSSRDLAVDEAELVTALRILTAGHVTTMPSGDYAAVGGIAGDAPDLVIGQDVPFDREVSFRGVPVEVRMDAWLRSDTIRRMGFGHVIAAHQHTLIVERGVSFAAFDDHGAAIQASYRANIFAPQPRYLIDTIIR
ncbi:MAG: hypothetical protein JWL71_1322, partial [Acidobacteria bacterium]|nr:hypothetical protein [Acidobacteriota bacterium]